MTEKKFLNTLANGKGDFLQMFLDVLKTEKISYCVIGGLAVNAYVEPVVSLDLDVVLVSDQIEALIPILKKKFKLERFANSINVGFRSSDLRIQIQMDKRYQAFIKHARIKDVLGYKMPVADIKDLFQGKVWAASDETRRPSKRQKDLADILRLMEAKAELKEILPQKLKKQLF